jgi:hypothetical protein
MRQQAETIHQVGSPPPVAAHAASATATFVKGEGNGRDTDVSDAMPLESLGPVSRAVAPHGRSGSVPASFILQYAEDASNPSKSLTPAAAAQTGTRNDGAGGGRDTDIDVMANQTTTRIGSEGAGRDTDVTGLAYTAMSLVTVAEG